MLPLDKKLLRNGRVGRAHCWYARPGQKAVTLRRVTQTHPRSPLGLVHQVSDLARLRFGHDTIAHEREGRSASVLTVTCAGDHLDAPLRVQVTERSLSKVASEGDGGSVAKHENLQEDGRGRVNGSAPMHAYEPIGGPAG